MKTRTKVGGVAAAVVAAAITIAVPHVERHEGVWLSARIDTIGTGRPITYCFGETEGNVRVGDRFTTRQCEDMLAKKLVRYANSAASCINVPVSPKMLASFIDFNYNVGESAFCKSTVVRKLNTGDYAGACEAMRSWTRSGGQFRQGLLNRRIDEIALCREGISTAKDYKLTSGPLTVVPVAVVEVAPETNTPAKKFVQTCTGGFWTFKTCKMVEVK